MLVMILLTILKEVTNMALTNAERQAAHKAKKQETLETLALANTSLLAENSKLRAQIAEMTEKVHQSEILTLKTKHEMEKLKADLKAKKAPKA